METPELVDFLLWGGVAVRANREICYGIMILISSYYRYCCPVDCCTAHNLKDADQECVPLMPCKLSTSSLRRNTGLETAQNPGRLSVTRSSETFISYKKLPSHQMSQYIVSCFPSPLTLRIYPSDSIFFSLPKFRVSLRRLCDHTNVYYQVSISERPLGELVPPRCTNYQGYHPQPSSTCQHD